MERVPVEGSCRECDGAELVRYPVLSDGGWFLTVTCQSCLAREDRQAWNRLGHVVRLEDML